jgi:mRNA-degrading endonuclease YafQ of YafQ-DinJ toxin-antitoxin module
MKIEYREEFIKHYKKRILSNSFLINRFEERLRIFQENPNNLLLKNHLLKGRKANLRAFSITGNIRVIYKKIGDTYYFFDIGTHNQVY